MVGKEKICGHSGSNHRSSLGRECIFESGEEKNLVAIRDRASDDIYYYYCRFFTEKMLSEWPKHSVLLFKSLRSGIESRLLQIEILLHLDVRKIMLSPIS